MNEKQIQEVMALVDDFAAKFATLAATGSSKARAAIERALREQVREVPARFVVTEEMHVAAVKVLHRATGLDGLPQRMVDAMLSAAPTQPAQAEQPAPAGSGGWKTNAEDMERERNYWRSRANLMHEHQKGQVWYWQGDGEDHLESICNSLPIVIRADALRALVTDSSQPSQVSQPKAAQQEPVHFRRWDDEAGRWVLSDDSGWPSEPLYTAAAPQREPMPIDQIDDLAIAYLGNPGIDPERFARAVERFHGITKKEQQ